MTVRRYLREDAYGVGIFGADKCSAQTYFEVFAQHFGDFGQGFDGRIAFPGMLKPLVRLVADAQLSGNFDLWTSGATFAQFQG